MTTALQAPAAFAKAFVENARGNLKIAADEFRDAIDEHGLYYGYIGTRSWALAVLRILEARPVTEAELEGIVVARSVAGLIRHQPLTMQSLGIIRCALNISEREALEDLLAGKLMETAAQSYRLVREEPKAPKPSITADDLAPSLREQLFPDNAPEDFPFPISIGRAQELVETQGELTMYERAGLAGYVGSWDEDLLVAWVEAIAELQQPQGPDGGRHPLDQVTIIDRVGGEWHADPTGIGYQAPERAYWVARALGNRSLVLEGHLGFYAPSIEAAEARLGVPQVRKEDRKLQEGHQAFVKAEQIAERNAALKAYQDSRNAPQVAA